MRPTSEAALSPAGGQAGRDATKPAKPHFLPDGSAIAAPAAGRSSEARATPPDTIQKTGAIPTGSQPASTAKRLHHKAHGLTRPWWGYPG